MTQALQLLMYLSNISVKATHTVANVQAASSASGRNLAVPASPAPAPAPAPAGPAAPARPASVSARSARPAPAVPANFEWRAFHGEE